MSKKEDLFQVNPLFFVTYKTKKCLNSKSKLKR